MSQPLNPALNSFVAGEISPLLGGRSDLDWYKSSCRRARNMVTLIEGGATRRPPSRFVAESPDSSQTTILRAFIFSQQQSRMLCFADKRICFFANNKAPIVNPDGSRYSITSPYAAADLRGLKFEQSADVVFIFHPNYEPKELQRYGDTDWRLVNVPFVDGPYLDVNGDNSMTLTPSATSGQITITAASGNAALHILDWSGTFPDPILPLNVNGITFSGNQVVLPAGTAPIATGTSLTLTGNVPEPINDTDGIFYYWISIDATHGNLARTSADATAGNAIDLAALPRVNFFKSTDVGRLIRIGNIANNWVKATPYAKGDLIKNQNQGVYICTHAGTSQNVDNAGPTGTGVGIGDGTVTWDFVNAGGVEWGHVRITGVTNSYTCTANVSGSLPKAEATFYWRMGAYSKTTGFPACGVLHQQRLILAGTIENPDRLDASKVADYPNFTPGDTDADPITETLGLPTVDPIYWLASKRVMLMGTQGDAQKVFGAEGYDSPLTPSSFVAIEQVRRGSKNLQPVRVGNGLAFVHRLSRKLYELYYDFTQDLDTANELSARARHMIATGIVDIAFQEEPYSIIWLANGAGQLVGVTYYRDQQVLGWHLHTLGGDGVVESIETMPGPSSDQVWLVVRRTINEVTKRYIEVLDDFNALGNAVLPEDLPFLDCYAEYQGAAATVISGLDYLEGMTVQILADGKVPDVHAEDGYVVTGGKITLPVPASKVYVGLDYSADSVLAPNPIVIPQPNGSPLGAKQKIGFIKVGLFRSGIFSAGPDHDHQTVQNLRTPEDLMDTPNSLFSGVYKSDPIDDEFSLEATIELRPVGPWPLTVLWAVPHVVVNAS